MRPTYQQIIDLVDECQQRRNAAGESNRMMSKWISEGLDALVDLSSQHPVMPEEPTDEMLRLLFTLNSATPRSTEEVSQTYTHLRNLVMRAPSPQPMERVSDTPSAALEASHE